jgi:hypothetical protein
VWLAGIAKKPPSWIWPAEGNRQMYWRIFGVLIFVNAFDFWLFLHCDGTELWVSACTIPLVAVIFTVLKLRSKDRIIRFTAAAAWLIMALWTGQHDPSLQHGASVSFWLAFTGVYLAFACLALPPAWLRLKTARPSLATVYALPATALLFTVGFIPALRLFNASVLFQNVLAARRSQLELADQLEQRQERISQAYFGIYGDEESAKGKFLSQRLMETRDLYFLDSTLPPPDTKFPLQSHRLEPLLLAISTTILEHDGSSQGHRSGLLNPDGTRQWFEDGPFPDAKLILAIDRPEKHRSAQEDALTGDYNIRWIVSALPQRVIPGLETGANPLVIVEMLLILTMLVCAFFALRDAIRRLFVLDWKQPEKKWPTVEIVPGLDLKNQTFGRHTVLLGAPCSGKTEALKQCSGVHYIDLIGSPQLEAEHLAPGPDKVVVLDHFEHNLDSPPQRQRKLNLLERLVYKIKCRVVIVSTVDPRYYFDRLAERKDSSEKESAAVSLDIERWTKVLATFYVVQAKNRSPIESERYFPLLWQTCSDEERVALHQIAKYGWANYLQEPALTHLFLRGLVKRAPGFDVKDQDFAAYIRDSISRENIVIPEDAGSADTLSAFRIVLVVAFVVFVAILAYVWGDQMVAYVIAGVSAVTTATRVFAKSKGRGQMGAEIVDV